MKVSAKGKVTGVKDSSAKLLQHLSALGIKLGTAIEVLEIIEFDGSMVIRTDEKKKITISKQVAENVLTA